MTILSAALALPLLLGGCAAWAPEVTATPYAPSDGLNADLDDVLVRNLLVVGQGEGDPAIVSAVLVNRTSRPVEVGLSTQDGALQASLEVPASGQLALVPPGAADDGATDEPSDASSAAPTAAAGEVIADSPESTETVVIDALPVLVGATLRVQLTTPSGGATFLSPPVMAAEFAYAGFLDGVEPTGSPSASGASAASS